MTTPLLLTARAFAGYLQCNTKGQLLARCTIAESPDYTELPLKALKTVAAGLIETSTSRCFIRYDELAHRFAAQDRRSYLIDYDTTYVEANQALVSQQLRRSVKSTKSAGDHFCAPVLFLPHEPIRAWHKTLLCFAAIAIYDVTRAIPSIGYICHGRDSNLKKIRVSDAINDTIAILNKHCSICEYRGRCHRIAVETDNLSLIGTIGEKERRKLLERGINTISQLSYGYRPRRRRRVHATARPVAALIDTKNDNKLRALAIKKKQIHVLHHHRR
jgi:hypothetical protein